MKNRIARLTLGSISYGIISLTIASNIVLPGAADIPDNPVVKNGNPCIEEICINDEVKSLVNLKWKKVPVNNVDYTSSLKAVGDPNAAKVFSRYWNIGRIDGIGLQALSKIKGFCQMPMDVTSLKGEYTNKKGQPVMVSFVAVPSKDGKSQKFIVTRILKFIAKGDFTPEQYTDLMNQAEVKYQSYYRQPNTSPRYPNVIINTALGHGAFLQIESQFGQLNPPDAVPINPSMFQYFSGCGGDQKIKL